MAYELYAEYRYSGGASNSGQTLSLGGVKSSVEIAFPAASWDGTPVAGITLTGSIPGVFGTGAIGDIDWIDSLKILQLQYTGPDPIDTLPGIVYLDNPTDGRYTLPFVDAPTGTTDAVYGLIVDIDTALLPSSDTTGNGVTLSAAVTGTMFTDLTTAQSATGITQYRCIYIQNIDTADHEFTFWAEESSQIATYSLGLSSKVVGTDEESLADEEDSTDVLSTQLMEWTASNDVDGGVAITIPAGSYKGLWIRRVIAPLNIFTATDDIVINSQVL